MSTLGIDTLRVNIFKELVNLDREQLQRVSDFIATMGVRKEREYAMPTDLLESALDYTMRMVEGNNTLYSTEQAFEQVDKRLGWK